jgi:hypothetical protein
MGNCGTKLAKCGKKKSNFKKKSRSKSLPMERLSVELSPKVEVEKLDAAPSQENYETTNEEQEKKTQIRRSEHRGSKKQRSENKDAKKTSASKSEKKAPH